MLYYEIFFSDVEFRKQLLGWLDINWTNLGRIYVRLYIYRLLWKKV